jgi:hypothetical protein
MSPALVLFLDMQATEAGVAQGGTAGSGGQRGATDSDGGQLGARRHNR